MLKRSNANLTLTPSPIHPDWIEEGEPKASSAVVGWSSDRTGCTIVWECTPGRFTWRYDCDEMVHFVSGSVVIGAHGERGLRYGAGDIVHFSKGDVATWVVEETVRKVAYCRRPMPPVIATAYRGVRSLVRKWRAWRTPGPVYGLSQA